MLGTHSVRNHNAEACVRRRPWGPKDGSCPIPDPHGTDYARQRREAAQSAGKGKDEADAVPITETQSVCLRWSPWPTTLPALPQVGGQAPLLNEK
ncbi:hypothetical protein E2C01_060193 [Portunus trituberculatus]|uniref:Uncharacterized protein n=1 Tax=Portunus trituberculatus TaxID=210409 RepID=A0A5B7H1K5_PORTR|nr:hypothetical protein [Portunus trituberculatus]